MMAGPQSYADHLTEKGYHPRSSKHGAKLALLVLEDLLSSCAPLREAAARNGVVYATDFDVQVADPATKERLPEAVLKDLSWNIDLALGPGVPDGGKKGKKLPPIDST